MKNKTFDINKASIASLQFHLQFHTHRNDHRVVEWSIRGFISLLLIRMGTPRMRSDLCKAKSYLLQEMIHRRKRRRILLYLGAFSYPPCHCKSSKRCKYNRVNYTVFYPPTECFQYFNVTRWWSASRWSSVNRPKNE